MEFPAPPYQSQAELRPSSVLPQQKEAAIVKPLWSEGLGYTQAIITLKKLIMAYNKGYKAGDADHSYPKGVPVSPNTFVLLFSRN